MKNIFLATLTLCLWCSCTSRQQSLSHQNENTSDTLFYSEPVDTVIPQYVSNIQYMPLERSEQYIITEPTKFRIKDGRIFIGSKFLHKLVVYDISGKFLYEIDRKGKSKQEYLEMISFAVDNRYVYTLDNFKHRINKYHVADGIFAGYQDISFVAWDIDCLGPDKFLFTYLPVNPQGKVDMKQPQGAVWTTDSLMQVKDTYLPYSDDDYEMIGKNVYFTQSGDSIVFHSHQQDGFWIFDSKSSAPWFTSVSFTKGIPDADRQDYKKVQSEMYNYIAETPIITKDYVLASISREDYTEPMMAKWKGGHFICNPLYDYHNNLFYPIGVLDNRFICYLSDYSTYEEMTASGFLKADAQTELLLRKGGGCLLFYTMKE